MLCIGKIESIEGHSEEHGGVFWDVLVPTYFEPTVPVMPIPEICPEAVREEVLNASAWVGCSPSSAGSKARRGRASVMTRRRHALVPDTAEEAPFAQALSQCGDVRL